MPRIYKDGVLYNTAPSTASQLLYDSNTSTKDKIDSKMDKANPTGTGSLSLNRKANTTIGDYSVAEGDDCQAIGNSSHAEGSSTNAVGENSHAEGYHTTASGKNSHAEGEYTIAQRKSQHVFGQYNIADTGGTGYTTEGTYIEIVGNGTSSASSNARTLDWDGNETLAGDLTIMGNKSLNAYITPSSTSVDKFNFYKCGRYVFCTMVAGNVTTDASGNVVINNSTSIIPSEYRPILNCESMATLPNVRCVFTTTGEILMPNTVSQTITLRVSGSWLSA